MLPAATLSQTIEVQPAVQPEAEVNQIVEVLEDIELTTEAVLLEAVVPGKKVVELVTVVETTVE